MSTNPWHAFQYRNVSHPTQLSKERPHKATSMNRATPDIYGPHQCRKSSRKATEETTACAVNAHDLYPAAHDHKSWHVHPSRNHKRPSDTVSPRPESEACILHNRKTPDWPSVSKSALKGNLAHPATKASKHDPPPMRCAPSHAKTPPPHN